MSTFSCLVPAPVFTHSYLDQSIDIEKHNSQLKELKGFINNLEQELREFTLSVQLLGSSVWVISAVDDLQRSLKQFEHYMEKNVTLFPSKDHMGTTMPLLNHRLKHSPTEQVPGRMTFRDCEYDRTSTTS